MFVCSGTMPTFEPLTTNQTNLALRSTIQTAFIDRRIAATHRSSGSSLAGIDVAGRPRAPEGILRGTAPRIHLVPAKPCGPASPRCGLESFRCHHWGTVHPEPASNEHSLSAAHSKKPAYISPQCVWGWAQSSSKVFCPRWWKESWDIQGDFEN